LRRNLAELRKFAKDNQLTVVVDTIIEKKSAKIPGRPKFGDMLTRIQNGEANGILRGTPTDLARNSIDGGQLIYLLDQRKLADLKVSNLLV
jgi:site-specific DNA recombinase